MVVAGISTEEFLCYPTELCLILATQSLHEKIDQADLELRFVLGRGHSLELTVV